MPTITVKNIPARLYERLKQSAESNRRSLNSEIIACIEQALMSQTIDPEAFLQRARSLRETTRSYILTDEAFNQAKREGRGGNGPIRIAEKTNLK
ncbi:MAG: Arc family DNA-binding protein [Anaerolineales bacterium]|nr:Arc family DNA-binding protein [Anaerolineales bacterium]